jgi:carboxyl-terminal processing protease
MPAFKTAAGRTVLGGGGIAPDVKLAQRPLPSKLQQKLANSYFDFANLYVGETKPSFANADAFRRDYVIPDDVVRRFEGFLKERKVAYSADSMRAEMADVRAGIKREMARNIYGDEARWEAVIDTDPQVTAALALFPQAEDMARKESAGDWQSRSR